MTDLLVTIILSVCSLPGGLDVDDKCVDKINNCAVEIKTLITEASIKKCLEEYNNEKQ